MEPDPVVAEPSGSLPVLAAGDRPGRCWPRRCRSRSCRLARRGAGRQAADAGLAGMRSGQAIWARDAVRRKHSQPSPKHSLAAQFFVAAFIDGDRAYRPAQRIKISDASKQRRG